jgi:pimeloyl-ACP methyl ester carboxylesterase
MPPDGELVDIGDRQLHLRCLGQGSPTVVFESGAGSPSIVWDVVQHSLADTVRVCSYDRAGIGWSDQSKESRTADQILGDLRALLHAASLPPPYVLVGHSLGGPLVIAYAHRYPAEVAALVLVDPTAARLALAQLDSATLVSQIQALATRTASEAGLTRLLLGRSRGATYIADYTRAFGARDQATALREIGDTDTILEEAAQVETFGALPLIVLSGGRLPSRVPLRLADQLQRFHDDLLAEHAALAQQSSRGEHRVLDVGHFIQLQQPSAVTRAVGDVLNIVRADAAR